VSDGGELSNKRVWCRFQTGEGFPDGMTTDAEGHVWVAHWGGARVTQRDASGAVVRTVDVDAPHVTNVAFGGPRFSDLFITTARDGLDAAALAASPLSGALFVLRDAGRGVAAASFDG
jgi:xylono-1,5-lactonase